MLLNQSADLSIEVKGIIWGKGYLWETLIPAVNPISYSMMGLLPQMHRDEATTATIAAIAATVQLLMQHRYGVRYELKNVPNKYLTPNNA